MSTQFLIHIQDHFLTYWTASLSLIIFDSVIRPRYTRLFKYPEMSLPNSWWKIISLVLFNQICVSIPTFYFFPDLSGKGSFSLLSLGVAVLLHEFFFYYIHRLIHTSYFYSRIHKIHHTWVVPIGVATFYAHPLEHLMGNVLPVILSGLLANMNFTTMRIWHNLAVLNAVIVAHGGYRISQSHKDHHRLFNINYGVLGILDRLHGTQLD